MSSPERKLARLKCHSCEHTFACSGNLFKHYRKFSEHRPEIKPLISCKEAADLFLDKDLSTYHRKARLRELFKERLTDDELVEFALPQLAKIVQTSQFMYEKCRIQKSGEIRKEAVKTNFTELCENIFRTFPSLPRELSASPNPCMATLLRNMSSLRNSTTGVRPLPSSREFLQFLDDGHEKKSLLEKLITDDNNLACETMLNCCEGKVFKSTLMPMFVKKYNEAFLEFGLGVVSSFNIGQNQVNSILRGHWGKRLEEKTGLNPILPR